MRAAGVVGLTLILVLPAAAQSVSGVQRVSLDEGWRFRAVASAEHPEATAWHPATVPGVVQTDLRKAGVIADPFFGDNEKRLQWIGNTDWEYTTEFTVSRATLAHRHLELVFAGLDTFADVELNGKPVLSANNQFRTWRVDAKTDLHEGKNTLRILFHSPTRVTTAVVEKLPYVLPGTGYETLDRAKGIYPVGHYMRKAPYAYGWDWGPRFVTEGIWRGVTLEGWDGAKVESLHLRQDSVTEERAVGEVELRVDSDASTAAMVRLRVKDANGKELPARLMPVKLDVGSNLLRIPLRIEHPQRWYPNGYGAQSRYTVAAEVVVGAKTVARAEIKTGLRSVELRRVPDQWGTSFTFVVNGIPVFAKGANFVPMDSFATDITDERRRALLTSARDVHMNILRIWGGGFYDSDSFYDLCDELGLMVWHDFMFGGAMVPGDKAFQDNVKAEADEQVARLSDHPSMVLWCGNNEVETAWHNWGDQIAFQKSVTPEQKERVWQDYVVMFRDILKCAVAHYGNGVAYWPSSPGSNFDDVPAGQENGDTHSWSVWSAGAPYQDYAKVRSRFVSEFGFQAMPDLQTVRSFAGTEEDLASPVLQNHERFIKGFDRMQMYLKGEFKPAKDFASFVYLSQLEQAEAIKFGVERWRSLRPETMGTIFWQLDDCWPVASWASIDYYGRWKALQYYAARFYAPLLIVAEPNEKQLVLHVVSDEVKPRTATLRVRVMGFDGTLVQEETRAVEVAALSSTVVAPVELKKLDAAKSFAVLTLEQDGRTLARDTVYFKVSKELALPAVAVAHAIRPEGAGYTVELKSPVLARAVALSFGANDAKFEDNYFDLLPGETRRIHVTTKVPMAELESSLTVRSLVDAAK
jgi:beta-mannosidase